MSNVIRVYGKADGFDIELSRNGEKWEVDIPPDMTDGVYAVQLTAVNEAGEMAHWIGELYMTNGVCCVRLSEVKCRVQFISNDLRTVFEKSRPESLFKKTIYSMHYQKNKNTLFVKNQRNDERRYKTEISLKLKNDSFFMSKALEISVKEKNLSVTDFNCTFALKTKTCIRKECNCG